MPVKLNSTGGGSVTLTTPSTASDFTATFPAATGNVVTTGSTAAVTPAMLTQPLTLATAQNSTSGTSIDFTGIPSWVRRVTVMFNGVSTNGTSLLQVRIGTSGGIDATGYGSGAAGNGTAANSTTGFMVSSEMTSAMVFVGCISILNISGNTWVASGSVGRSDNVNAYVSGGNKTLSGTLDRIRITTVNGTDTFDAGSINILYE